MPEDFLTLVEEVPIEVALLADRALGAQDVKIASQLGVSVDQEVLRNRLLEDLVNQGLHVTLLVNELRHLREYLVVVPF